MIEKNLEYRAHAQHAQGLGFKSQQNTESPFPYAVFIRASTLTVFTHHYCLVLPSFRHQPALLLSPRRFASTFMLCF